MQLALALGLLSALLYGVTDFVARFANRETGVLPTMLWGQACVAFILTLIALVLGKLPHGSMIDWTILTASNLAIVAGTACLYHGLAVGRITIVTPIMASYGAVAALLAIFTGEKTTPVAIFGLALAAGGAVLSALGGKKTATAKSSGWLPAAGAALLYGLGFWLQGKYVVPVFGAMSTLWIYYLMAVAMTAIISRLKRQDVKLDSARDIALVLGSAFLAAGGYAALAAGQTTGKIAIVTALSAASPAVTAILAFTILREKPALTGWLGIAAVTLGVAILHLAQ